MMRFRSLRTALVVASCLLALSVVSGQVSAADATLPTLAAPQLSQLGRVHDVAPRRVTLRDMRPTIQLESPLDSLIGFEA
jgi:hypothetical protein